ncbi:glycoside hydrolase family 93 protein [Dothidotthia symphoricarpi CBS 119687]|uniref:Glycoside hydrolase family 93 protein n=1 Tax=Dothidotthia symphoricarpi CBS 119687 TaxID=1392245 RepID=A0A6A5ZYK4_9PLEO|nr:glycoside hydrolase family 93 protein [Dothidotthia symphoricarpi CBS 119687]KAF2124376.1 glycoside hydrolase family 93 protein [Dothidotthia symphoricarpi CBS 119687]
MRLSSFLFGLLPLLSVSVSASPSTQLQSRAPSTFSRRVIFTPPANYSDPRVLYARSAELSDGTLLATWENYSPEPPLVYFPIYQSRDNGYTWHELSRVQDTQKNWGLRYQPFLYVLPEKFGGFPKGTVLLSGSAIPTDLSQTLIELYASTDRGKTWKFVSHIAAGGEAVPNNGLTPVWEPFLMLHNHKLICYYSDQRDNATHGQKMVHQTTLDGKTWGPVVDDVAYPTYTDRPGMPTVAQLPNGKFIMTYEYGGGPTSISAYQFPVYFKIAADPEAFGAVTGVPLVVSDGTIPTGSPYVVWSSVGGKNGTLIVSSSGAVAGTGGRGNGTQVYINQKLGQGNWTIVDTPEGASYTRHLRVLRDQKRLLIMGGGVLPPTTEINRVTVSVVDISRWRA